jgi:hypothetical protein
MRRRRPFDAALVSLVALISYHAMPYLPNFLPGLAIPASYLIIVAIPFCQTLPLLAISFALPHTCLLPASCLTFSCPTFCRALPYPPSLLLPDLAISFLCASSRFFVSDRSGSVPSSLLPSPIIMEYEALLLLSPAGFYVWRCGVVCSCPLPVVGWLVSPLIQHGKPTSFGVATESCFFTTIAILLAFPISSSVIVLYLPLPFTLCTYSATLPCLAFLSPCLAFY